MVCIVTGVDLCLHESWSCLWYQLGELWEDQRVTWYVEVLIVLCTRENVDPKMSFLVVRLTVGVASVLVLTVSVVAHIETTSHSWWTGLNSDWYFRPKPSPPTVSEGLTRQQVMTQWNLSVSRWQFYQKRRLLDPKVRRKRAQNMVILR